MSRTSGGGLVITGTVYVDLSQVDSAMALYQRGDRYLLDVLNRVPDGACVIVDIGDRSFVTQDAARWLHEHDHRLSIDIHGTDPDAVARFIRAGRAGEWSVVA